MEEEEEYSSHFQQRVLQPEDADEDQVKLRKMFERKEETCQSEMNVLQSYLANGFNEQKINLQLQNMISTQRNQLDISEQVSELRHSIDQTFQQDITCLQQAEQKENICQKDQLVESRQLDDSQSQGKTAIIQPSKLVQRSSFLKKSYIEGNKKRNRQESQKDTSIFMGGSGNIFKGNKELNLILKIKNKMNDFFLNYTLSGRRYLLLNPKIRQSINDKSDCTDDVNQNWFANQLERLYIYFKSIKSKITAQIPLFNPQHPAMFVAQIILSSINCLFFVLLSTLVVFDAQIEDQEKLITFIISMWVIEILIKLNTVIYINTTLVSNRDTIYGSYIKKSALYDIIPLITLLSSPENPTTRVIFHIITFMKLKNIGDELVDIQKQLCMAIKNYFYVQIFNLIVKLFLVAHIIALMYFLVGLIEIKFLGEPSTWYDISIGADGTWWKLYLVAFYWSLTLMATGSNIADTTFQIFFTSFIMLFTTIIFGYFLNMIGIILSEIDEQELNKRRDINIINELMRKRNISKQISYDKQVSKTLSVLGKEQVFGQVSFFTGQVRQAQARSISFTTIIKIKREIFLDIIKENEKDFQQFHYIKDNIHLYKNFEKIKIQCMICSRYTHFTSDCPLVHVNREQLQSKVRYYEKIQQNRMPFQRKKSTFNSLCLTKRVQGVSELFISINLQQQMSFGGQDDSSSCEQYEDQSVMQQNLQFDQQIVNIEEELEGKFIDSIQQNNIMETSQSNGQDSKRQNKSILMSSRASVFKEEEKEISQKKNSYDEKEMEIALLKRPHDITKSRTIQINESILPMSNLNMDVSGKKMSLQKTKTKKVDLVQVEYDHQASKKDQLLNNNPWMFDMQKDYTIYFPEGNCKIQISKYNRQVKKKGRQNSRKSKLKYTSYKFQ